MAYNELSESEVVSLYEAGFNIRQIARITRLQKEGIGPVLKRHGVRLRGRWVRYKPLSEFFSPEKIALAKLFGYLLGDGSVSRNKDGRYECSLSFALTEKEYVDEVKNTVEFLFSSTPRIKKVNESFFRILPSRSIARYLHEECHYPLGKKSITNPCIPAWVMDGEPEVKASFIIGFVNAEASFTDENRVKIRQAVRIFPPEDVTAHLRQVAKIRTTTRCHYLSLPWRKGKVLCEPYTRQSNILADLQELLKEFQIKAKIYSYWIWISLKNCVSVHYELNVNKSALLRLANF